MNRSNSLFVAVATVTTACAAAGHAQTAADSSSIAQALALHLAQDSLVGRYELRPDSGALVEAAVRHLGARGILAATERPPRCPWGWTSTDGRPFGYRFFFVTAAISSGSAAVVVHLTCDNPPGYTHGRFVKRVEFRFRRGADGWVFTESQLLLIT